ncbi:MAG TPA: hypothetical protein VEC19_08870 [Usitatibacter sp.]|nr:hypothetical protein [Usitatibacter sp.]
MTRQRGASGLFIAVVLLFLIAGMAATLVLLQRRGQGDRVVQEDRRFETLHAALLQFVIANGRLPCPANPSLDTGAEEGNVAAGTCTSPTGSVPWMTIGARRDDAVDAWGWKISYRVYAGNAGSLTQTNGMNMADCDTFEAAGWSAGRTPVVGSAGGLCRGTRNTLDTEFLAGKGLAVNYFGTIASDAAYVLISHGPAGQGAWSANSPPAQNPTAPANASELVNLSNTNPAIAYVASTRVTAGVAPSSASYFDDVLVYRSLKDVVRLAGRNARDWDDTGTANETLTAANLAASLGTTPTAGSDLGVSTVNLQTSRVTGLSAGTATNLAFDSSGGTEGLGVSGSGTGITSAVNESVRIEFKNKATKFAISLADFATVNFIWTWREQASFQFYNNGSLVFTSPDKQSCHTGPFASFSFDLGAIEFDRVDVVPKIAASNTLPFFGTGPSIATSFYLSGFKSCTAAPCLTDLQVATPTSTCS